MKSKMRQKSIEMRKQGHSVKEITDTLHVSKGSVSTWVRGVMLTPQQKLHLKNKTHSPDVIEKRRQSRLNNEFNKRAKYTDTASREIRKIDRNMLKMIGIGLYWGEGAKTMKGMARISNSDPSVIGLTMRFFREICDIKNDRFRAHIHIHSNKAAKEAEKYWSKITGIPLSQFYKTYTVKSKSSQGLRKTLQYGTIDVGVCDTKILLRILGWIEGVKRQII
jgi:predicted transcriptional regulator